MIDPPFGFGKNVVSQWAILPPERETRVGDLHRSITVVLAGPTAMETSAVGMNFCLFASIFRRQIERQSQ
jgi:hypothetical protein